MSPGRLSPAYPPLRWSLLLACAVQIGALFFWGSPELIHDEVDYITQGQLLSSWFAGEDGASLSEALGRIALHNPGYAALAAGLEALTGHGALLLRILQSIAGLVTGVVLFRALSPRLGERIALLAALVFWLHPSMIFFRLTLWPVAFASLGTALLGAVALQLLEGDERASSARRFAWTLAVLPFFAPSAWLFIPLAAVGFGQARLRVLCGPALALWLPWMLALSLTLGTFVPTDLSASRNVALANHPAITEGRGSLWGDPENKAVYLSELAAACPSTDLKERKRCEHAFNLATAWSRVTSSPSEAIARALRRTAETWGPDQFLIRHLTPDASLHAGLTTDEIGPLRLLVSVLHLLLLGGALLGLRTPQGRAALLAAVVWTLPVLVAVGFTRLRQPMLPFLLIAAAFGIHSLVGRKRSNR